MSFRGVEEIDDIATSLSLPICDDCLEISSILGGSSPSFDGLVLASCKVSLVSVLASLSIFEDVFVAFTS